ncbi:protein tyrosine phosphatase, partial [Amycolatopsis magusensis]|nr:protein tyrosine phosphatase [Amycolatopsis magusensis]
MSLHVSFVCSGNICRSPMAALVFREQLRRAGLADRVRVSSAGIGPWHVGEPAD